MPACSCGVWVHANKPLPCSYCRKAERPGPKLCKKCWRTRTRRASGICMQCDAQLWLPGFEP